MVQMTSAKCLVSKLGKLTEHCAICTCSSETMRKTEERFTIVVRVQVVVSHGMRMGTG